jgi:predicted ArsR family transcriptional regulator
MPRADPRRVRPPDEGEILFEIEFRKQLLFKLRWPCYSICMSERSSTRLLHALKSAGPQTAAAIGGRLGVTAVAARQHLAKLLEDGLVAFEDRRAGVGRPERVWSLTAAGHARFPDSHAGLTLELLQAVQKVFGAEGLEQLIAERERASLRLYRSQLQGEHELGGRVRALAALRSREGYMAEAEPMADGGWLLRENHCPICAAATTCQGLCRSEMALFRAVLGPSVEIERIEHVLAGARRCAYRITPSGPG